MTNIFSSRLEQCDGESKIMLIISYVKPVEFYVSWMFVLWCCFLLCRWRWWRSVSLWWWWWSHLCLRCGRLLWCCKDTLQNTERNRKNWQECPQSPHQDPTEWCLKHISVKHDTPGYIRIAHSVFISESLLLSLKTEWRHEDCVWNPVLLTDVCRSWRWAHSRAWHIHRQYDISSDCVYM